LEDDAINKHTQSCLKLIDLF